MKTLIVGGAFQGKRAYAQEELGLLAGEISDGGSATFEEVFSREAVDRLHLLVKRLLDEGRDPEGTVLSALDSREDWIILCDEIGCGIVPMDASDRLWREKTGRICCSLAERADRVIRLTCGVARVLKG